MNRPRLITGILVIMGLVVSQVLAVKPEVWEHEQPKDFTAGKLENIVVSSLGEVMLGRETETFFESEDDTEVFNALAQAGDGKIYAASGPHGVIYQIDGNKVNRFATLPGGGTIFSLLFAGDGRLLAGTGGGVSRIFGFYLTRSRIRGCRGFPRKRGNRLGPAILRRSLEKPGIPRHSGRIPGVRRPSGKTG